MGTYMYRVTARKVVCSDGVEANVAMYAYKPTYSGWNAEKQNARWHFETGCVSSDRLAKAGKLSGRIVLEYNGEIAPEVYANMNGDGSFPDGNLGCAAFPKLQDVTFERVLP